MERFICSFMDYISKSKPTRYDYPLTIIRQKSIYNQFVPAYFNIDALVEKWELRHSLYTSEFALEKALKEDGQDVIVLPPFIQKEEEHIVPDKTEKKEATRLKRLSTIDKLKHDLIEWENNRGNEYALNEICSKVEKRMQDTIVHGFKVLHLYYPSDELLDKLIEGYFSGKGFKNIFNAAVFYALPLDETFKAKALLKFGCDNSTGKSKCYITPQQRIDIIGECFVETFKLQPKTEPRNLSELATSFFSFKTKKGKYCPTGYNPYDLPEPINTIPLGILTPSLFILPRKEDKL